MKKVLFLLLAFCALTATVKAQTILQDTASGGQMSFTTGAIYNIPDSTTARVRYTYSFNSNFNPAFSAPWDTIANQTDSTVYLSQIASAVPVTSPGSYYVIWEMQFLTNNNVFLPADTSNPRVVLVVPVPIAPKIDTLALTPSATGAVITYKYHAGFENALIHIKARPFGGSIFADYTQSVTDSGIASYTLTGWPANYTIECYLTIENSANSDQTNMMTFSTLPSGQPWVGPVDSSNADTSHIEVWFKVVSNGNNFTVKSYLMNTTNVVIDSVTNIVTGQAGITTKHAAFTAVLTSGTQYLIRNCIVTPPSCSADVPVWTKSVPTVFTIIADSIAGDAANHTVSLIGRVWIPSGETATIGIYGALGVDVSYTNILYAPPVVSGITQGYWANFMLKDTTVALMGQTLRFKFFGFTNQGGYTESGSKLIQLVMPSDTTKPVVSNFDTVDVTNTTITVTFSATDNVGVTAVFPSLDGTIVATLAAGTTSYTFTGLTAGSTHTIGIQVKDAANNLSLFQAMTVVTDMGNGTPTIATLTSIPDPFYFYESGNSTGWQNFTATGVNFQPDALVVANYYDGLPNDTMPAIFISSTSIGMRIWTWSHYSAVDFWVVNPGAGPSNVLRTKVIDGGTTSVQEVDRAGNMIAAYPNPFKDVITVKLETEQGKPLQYFITNLLGAQVATGELAQGEQQINLHELPNGVYILKTSTGLTKKIVKQ